MAQFVKRLKDKKLALLQPALRNLPVDIFFVKPPPLLVEPPLFVAHLDVQHLLDFVRQFGEHVFLQPTQHKRINFLPQFGHHVEVVLLLNRV